MKKHASSDPRFDSDPEIFPWERQRGLYHRLSNDMHRIDHGYVERMVEHRMDHHRAEDLEGEGSYTATRRYREGLERSIRKGNMDELAKEAEEALDGPEGDDLRRAAEAAQRGPRESFPSFH